VEVQAYATASASFPANPVFSAVRSRGRVAPSILVGAWYGGSGGGTLSAVLTHYRTRILGTCLTYSASVVGMLTLSF
jgi:hypothetical protein